MPSFRVTVEVGAMRPGRHPDDVIATARAATSKVAHLDDSHIDLVRGRAVIRVRYAVADGNDEEEDQSALAVARHVVDALDPVAAVPCWWVERRRRGDWLPVADLT